MDYLVIFGLLLIAVVFLYNIIMVVFYSNTPCLLTRNTEIDVSQVTFKRRNLLKERSINDE